MSVATALAAKVATSAVPEHELLKAPHGIRLRQWRITSAKSHILDSTELDKLKDDLKLPALPEMVFGNNDFSFAHEPSGFRLSFNVQDAFREWDSRTTDVKVASAKKWSAGAAADIEAHKVPLKDFDWTFSTSYRGTLIPPSTRVSTTEERIPLDMLRREDPIMFFDEMVLFEDELGDNGEAKLTVKARVMPMCLFVLAQLFLRVDGVVFRTLETRVFHEFGRPYLLREVQKKEGNFAAVRAQLTELQHLSDPNRISSLLAAQSLVTERIDLPAP